jgi:hypothetical protein
MSKHLSLKIAAAGLVAAVALSFAVPASAGIIVVDVRGDHRTADGNGTTVPLPQPAPAGGQ